MMYLVNGGSASGKSAYAENLAMKSEGTRYYVATMEVCGEEGHKRVARHRAMREGKGFVTVECCHHLDELKLPQSDPGGQLPAILLECMTNLAANEQFSVGGSDEEILKRILDGVRNLRGQADPLIVVTGEVASDGVDYGQEVRRYQYLLGSANRQLAEMADVVTEVVYGIPVCIRKRPEKG